MKTAKLGAMFLVSIMALAGMGAAYAWWHEDLVIDGTVTTGTFGWEFSLYSGWKDGDWKDASWCDVWLGDYADVDEAGTPIYAKSLNFEIINAFPCVYYWMDWDLHFYGSVPGHIETVTAVVEENGAPIGGIPAYMDLHIDVYYSDVVDIPEGVYTWDEFVAILVGSQWHGCEYIEVLSYIHFTEYEIDQTLPIDTETPQDTTIDLTITMTGYQYNHV